MSKTRVLVVEDNRADARLLEEIFFEIPGRPFRLTLSATLADAVQLAPAHDVVLLDLSLPDAHGLSTVERMVAAARATPIVVLTGNDDEQFAMDAVKAGAQDYLLKAEITPSLVARSIRYAVERKRVELVELMRARSDQAASRARFVAAVTAEVTRALDLQGALLGLARVVIPRLGDVAVIDLVQPDGSTVPVAQAGYSGPLGPIVKAWGQAVSPVLDALEGRSSVRLSELAGRTLDERHGALVEHAGASSFLVTPLIAREQVIGTITYAFGPSRRHDEHDELLAEEVASHAALAIDNARLFEQAQHAVRGRDALLAVVSHDLRNPISVISLALQILEDGHGLQRAQTLERARRALKRMQHLIDDLLDVARVDAGTLQVNAAPVELSHVLDDAYELHRPLCNEKNVLLVREYGQALGHVLADRDRVAQALGNLIGNAIKFTPSGGTIRLSAKGLGPSVEISVSDTGSGISEEYLPHVFDRFWQKERDGRGVGLGLAIVKGIVDAHGGAVHVTSKVGAGTTFWFTLPRPLERAVELASVAAR